MPVPLDIFVLQLPSIVVIADDFELLDGICEGWLLDVADDADVAEAAVAEDTAAVGVVNDVEVIVLVAAGELDVLFELL